MFKIPSPITYPCSIQVYGDKGLRDGEEVDKRVQLKHKPKLVRSGDKLKIIVLTNSFVPGKAHSDEEVDHEKYVEAKIDLLGGVLYPSCTCLHSKAAKRFV